MTRTVFYPYCHHPHVLPESQGQEPGEVYCENCRGVLTRGLQAADRPTILWIDDDRLLLSLCTDVLERHGYRVLFATNGQMGIDISQKERPDAIFLDDRHADDARV